jgi:hypothetical protein
MCLIIASPKGLTPPKDIVANALENNPDGWGIMVARDGRIDVHKGFKNRAAKKAIKRAAGFPFVFHARYATHGNVDVSNCHPFRVTEDTWLAHNGIIPGVAKPKDVKSDSWQFAEALAEIVTTDTLWFRSSLFVRDVADWIGPSNKMAFLRAEGKIEIANEDMGVWKDGLWYSNSYAFRKPIVYTDIDTWEGWTTQKWKTYPTHSTATRTTPAVSYYGSNLACDYCGRVPERTHRFDQSVLCDLCYQSETEFYARAASQR